MQFLTKHVLHEYNLTDHATSYFSIDFTPNNKGPGVFRAHPSLLKNQDYKNLIDNSIRRTLLEDLKNKNSHFFIQNMANLERKESLENEINWLKNMENKENWDINQKILTLASEILYIKDELAATQLILNQDHLTDDDLLL